MSSSSVVLENHLVGNMNPEKFKWLGVIGKGGFGIVYKCLHENFEGKEFAIKRFVLLSGHKDNQEKINKINVELNNLFRVTENIIKPKSIPDYYGHFIEQDKYGEKNFCLVFQFYPRIFRSHLSKLKKENKLIQFNDLKTYFEELLKGLAFLQSIEMSHRDLKPENLAIDYDQQIKMIDFGFSKDIGELIKLNNLSPNETKFKITLGGTESYMSPEIIRSWIDQIRNPINAYKSDVFTFGLIMLEMVCLSKISNNKDLDSMQKDITRFLSEFKHSFIGLKGEDKNIFKKIRRIVRNCVSMDENKRPDFLTIFQEYYTFSLSKEKKLLRLYVDGSSTEEIQILCGLINKNINNREEKKLETQKNMEILENNSELKFRISDLEEILIRKDKEIEELKKQINESKLINSKNIENNKNNQITSQVLIKF